MRALAWVMFCCSMHPSWGCMPTMSGTLKRLWSWWGPGPNAPLPSEALSRTYRSKTHSAGCILTQCTFLKYGGLSRILSVYYPIIRVRKCVAAWPCSTTCWNQSRGFHGMRCCSGITWRNSPKITQIMSSLAVSMLCQCLCQSIDFFIMCPQSTNYHIYMVTLCIGVSVSDWLFLSLMCRMNLPLSLSRVLADNFHGSHPLKQRHPQSCTLPLHAALLFAIVLKISSLPHH